MISNISKSDEENSECLQLYTPLKYLQEKLSQLCKKGNYQNEAYHPLDLSSSTIDEKDMIHNLFSYSAFLGTPHKGHHLSTLVTTLSI